MALFHVSETRLAQLKDTTGAPGRERGLQRLLEANLEAAFGVRFVATEFSTGARHGGRIDTLGLDEDGSPVIIEYKEFEKGDVISQGLFYLDWLIDHRGDFEKVVREGIGEAEVDWSDPRLLLVAQSFTRYDRYAINRIGGRIELWTYRFFDDGHMAIERLGEEERGAQAARRPVAGRRAAESRAAAKLAEAPKPIQQLFEQLREAVLDLGDDISERHMRQYVGFKARRNFVCVVPQKSQLKLYLSLVDPFDDPRGMAKDVKGIGHWGTGDFEVRMSDGSDVPAVMDLVQQAYKAQR